MSLNPTLNGNSPSVYSSGKRYGKNLNDGEYTEKNPYSYKKPAAGSNLFVPSRDAYLEEISHGSRWTKRKQDGKQSLLRGLAAGNGPLNSGSEQNSQIHYHSYGSNERIPVQGNLTNLTLSIISGIRPISLLDYLVIGINSLPEFRNVSVQELKLAEIEGILGGNETTTNFDDDYYYNDDDDENDVSVDTDADDGTVDDGDTSEKDVDEAVDDSDEKYNYDDVSDDIYDSDDYSTNVTPGDDEGSGSAINSNEDYHDEGSGNVINSNEDYDDEDYGDEDYDDLDHDDEDYDGDEDDDDDYFTEYDNGEDSEGEDCVYGYINVCHDDSEEDYNDRERGISNSSVKSGDDSSDEEGHNYHNYNKMTEISGEYLGSVQHGKGIRTEINSNTDSQEKAAYLNQSVPSKHLSREVNSIDIIPTPNVEPFKLNNHYLSLPEDDILISSKRNAHKDNSRLNNSNQYSLFPPEPFTTSIFSVSVPVQTELLNTSNSKKYLEVTPTVLEMSNHPLLYWKEFESSTADLSSLSEEGATSSDHLGRFKRQDYYSYSYYSYYDTDNTYQTDGQDYSGDTGDYYGVSTDYQYEYGDTSVSDYPDSVTTASTASSTTTSSATTDSTIKTTSKPTASSVSTSKKSTASSSSSTNTAVTSVTKTTKSSTSSKLSTSGSSKTTLVTNNINNGIVTVPITFPPGYTTIKSPSGTVIGPDGNISSFGVPQGVVIKQGPNGEVYVK
ncbi:hypothetical protein SK128_012564, partial [Halocaridina rubra]